MILNFVYLSSYLFINLLGGWGVFSDASCSSTSLHCFDRTKHALLEEKKLNHADMYLRRLQASVLWIFS